MSERHLWTVWHIGPGAHTLDSAQAAYAALFGREPERVSETADGKAVYLGWHADGELDSARAGGAA